jgi:hypothetical protein
MMVGRRTGVQMKQNVKQNAQGFDDIDDFWGDEQDTKTTTTTSTKFASPPPRFSETSSTPSPAPAPSPSPFFTPGDMSTGMTPDTNGSNMYGDNNNDMDDSMPMEENVTSSEEEEVQMMVSSPESSPEPVMIKKKKKKKRGPKKKQVSKKAQAIARKKKKQKKKRKRVLETPIPSKGRPDPIPNMTAEKELAISNGLRRSKRQRWKPLQYWKNERIGFEVLPGQTEPTVIGAVRDGCPTPLLKKSDRTPQSKTPHYLKKKGRKKKQAKYYYENDSEQEEEEESPVKLPRGYECNRSDYVKFNFKDKNTGDVNVKKTRAVMRNSDLFFKNLPGVPGYPAPEAAGSLDTDVFTSGELKLAPGCFKDLEGVSGCHQIFYCVESQAQALEFQVGRATEDGNLPSLLGKGDHFYVHPHNSYSLHNHSRSKTAVLHFLVIKPQHDV